jgi:hypothetical protein
MAVSETHLNPGETLTTLREAEWNAEKGDWIFGKRVDDA